MHIMQVWEKMAERGFIKIIFFFLQMTTQQKRFKSHASHETDRDAGADNHDNDHHGHGDHGDDHHGHHHHHGDDDDHD